MSYENPNQSENVPVSEIEIEKDFDAFVPEGFRADPFGYFEAKGRNIKSGEIQYDEQGGVKEDPTATKDLPIWKNEQGEELHTVGKKVNTIKSQVGKSGDPFYEYSIMEIAREFDLPAPVPIAKVKRDNEHLVVMKKIEGIRWTDEGMKPITESDLTDTDKQDLLTQAQQMMDDLQKQYERIGLSRNWKLKDMIFDVDIPGRKVLKVTPTDWERTKIDIVKLVKARKERGQ
ncbi:MAG: hypothetical protein WAX44_02680 [Minisyncoccia bacterium]